MTGYLTNTPLENQARCEYAAKKSGLNVEFRAYPMPWDPHDSTMSGYYKPEAYVGVYGSVYTHEHISIDHSSFWDAWDQYDG